MPYGGTIFSTVNADLVQADVDALVQGLTGSGGKTLTDVQDRLNLGLFDFGMVPWLEMTNDDLYSYLYNQGYSQPWMETLTYAIDDGFYYHMNDPYASQPWLQTIHHDLDDNLYDWTNGRPWMESLRDEMSAVRAVLEDVHDAAQHALRTV